MHVSLALKTLKETHIFLHKFSSPQPLAQLAEIQLGRPLSSRPL